MTRDETVALFEACEAKRGEARAAALADGKSEHEARDIAHEAAKAHWNAWAEPLLAGRKAMEADDRWAAEKDIFGSLETENAETRAWIEKAAADFSRCLFLLPGAEGAKEAAGEDSKEDGGAGPPVKSIQLEGDQADLSGFVFPGDAQFASATFTGDAWFDSATFAVDARFASATFTGVASFETARFRREANFSGIDSKRAFRLIGARFRRQVPDFLSAKFAEPVLLDNVQLAAGIEPGGLLRSMFSGAYRWRKRKLDPALSAKYRALKRLAIQSDDHRNEQIFFRGELRARRYNEDKPWHPAFWFGILYEIASDFGRSILRPILLLIALSLVSSWFYLGRHLPPDTSPRSHFQARLLSHLPMPASWLPQAPPLACKDGGPGDPAAAAELLAFKKTSVFASFDSAEKGSQIYACLYGVQAERRPWCPMRPCSGASGRRC